MTAVISGSGTTTSGLINVGSAVSTTGTSTLITGIPSTAKRVTVIGYNIILTSASGFPQLQLGSGSVQATGYTGYVGSSAGAGSSGVATSFYIMNPSGSGAGAPICFTATLVNVTGSNWVLGSVGASGSRVCYATGFVALSGALDRIQLSTSATDSFTSGTLNIFWE